MTELIIFLLVALIVVPFLFKTVKAILRVVLPLVAIIIVFVILKTYIL